MLPNNPCSESAKEIVAPEEGGKRKSRKVSAEDKELTKKLKMGTVVQRSERQLKESSTLNEVTKVWNFAAMAGLTMITSYSIVARLF